MVDYKFWIVDDDQDDHEFISAAIKKTHPEAQVKSFFDGADVELLIQQLNDSDKPHVILLDLNMRIVDGKTTLRNMREHGALKNIPVVILTTDKNPYSKPYYVELGASDFYSKPYELREMAKIINKITNDWLQKQATV
jgi:chemotaxis family two-component system response regulator Rcp1